MRLVLVAMIVAACGGCDSLVGGGSAHIEVLVVGDAGAGSSSSAEGALSPVPGPALQSTPPFEGSVTTRMRVLLRVGSGFPITVSGGDREVEVDLLAETPASLGDFVVSPGLYQGLSLVFTEVTANVTSGLASGDGSGLVQVDFGGDGVLIVDALGGSSSVGIQEGSRMVVTVDLGARDWLGTVTAGPEPRTVNEETFEAFVRVSVRFE